MERNLVEREEVESNHKPLIEFSNLTHPTIHTMGDTSWGGELKRARVRPDEGMIVT